MCDGYSTKVDFSLARLTAGGCDINMRDKVPDIINNTEELLDLLFEKILVGKVYEFLGNVFSWLIVVIFDGHSKEFNVSGGNSAFLS